MVAHVVFFNLNFTTVLRVPFISNVMTVAVEKITGDISEALCWQHLAIKLAALTKVIRGINFDVLVFKIILWMTNQVQILNSVVSEICAILFFSSFT